MSNYKPHEHRIVAQRQRQHIVALRNENIKLTLQRDAALRHLLDLELRNRGACLDRPEVLPRPAADIRGDLVLPTPRH